MTGAVWPTIPGAYASVFSLGRRVHRPVSTPMRVLSDRLNPRPIGLPGIEFTSWCITESTGDGVVAILESGRRKQDAAGARKSSPVGANRRRGAVSRIRKHGCKGSGGFRIESLKRGSIEDANPTSVQVEAGVHWCKLFDWDLSVDRPSRFGDDQYPSCTATEWDEVSGGSVPS